MGVTELDTYVAEGGGASEAARLEALQGGLDANTIRYLNRLGVRPVRYAWRLELEGKMV